MKGMDWDAVLSLLPRWEALSSGARDEALVVRPERGAPRKVFGPALAELEAAGFVRVTDEEGGWVWLVDDVAAGVEALAMLDRVPILQFATGSCLYNYVSAVLRPADVSRALEGSPNAWSYPHPARLTGRVGSARRAQEFLALETAAASRAWAKRMLDPALLGRWEPVSLTVAVQRLLRALVERGAPVPLIEVGALLPGLEERHAAAVLDAATRLLFVFAGLGEDDRLPRVTAWPPLARRLRRPPGPPAAVEPAERFEAPWLVGDMTAIMVDAAAEPIRLRADGGIFVRAARAIAGRLAPLPEWFPSLLWDMDEDEPDFDADDEDAPRQAEVDVDNRVPVAALWLQGTGLVDARGARGGEPRLEPTPAGRAWLARGERDRLAHLLDNLRRRKERNPPGPYGGGEILPFFPVAFGFTLPKGLTLDTRAAATEALLALPHDGFVLAEDFFDSRAREGNPFLVPEVRKALGRRGWDSVSDEDEVWEELWRALLDDLVAERLAPLGGVRLGRTPDGQLAVGITSVGRYLLGAADDFVVETATETGAVVVQPDFEVVFLAPAPRAEAEVGRFAERTSKGVGATFRITRASVLRAAEAGTTAEEITAVLRDAAGREPPANVVRQVRDWLAATRRVVVAPAVLVECPDEETAARVLAAGGKAVQAVSPTVLRLNDATAKGRSALVKKMRAVGLFVAG